MRADNERGKEAPGPVHPPLPLRDVLGDGLLPLGRLGVMPPLVLTRLCRQLTAGTIHSASAHAGQQQYTRTRTRYARTHAHNCARVSVTHSRANAAPPPTTANTFQPQMLWKCACVRLKLRRTLAAYPTHMHTFRGHTHAHPHAHRHTCRSTARSGDLGAAAGKPPSQGLSTASQLCVPIAMPSPSPPQQQSTSQHTRATTHPHVL